MWPPSGMSLQIILFGKIIHRTVELDMSSLVKVLVLTDQERGKCRPNSLSVDEASKNRSSDFCRVRYNLALLHSYIKTLKK